MESAEIIRRAVSSVAAIRLETLKTPGLSESVVWVKSFQANRFRGTYSDLMDSSEFGPPTQFFLEELYSDKDYSERDAQFAKIAGALQSLFPKQVVQTAVSLAELHQLTEELDFLMGKARNSQPSLTPAESSFQYVDCWRAVGRRVDRDRQLQIVLQVGAELERLTRTPGLRLMLRMMRGPAQAAGLGALQRFLEAGFDTFAALSHKKDHTQKFLGTIQRREASLIDDLSIGERSNSATKLNHLLRQM